MIPYLKSQYPDIPFVYTSNIFAILGLRSLYFMLAAAADKFSYLKIGLAAVLVLIGTKIIWNFLLNNGLTFRDKNAGATAGFGMRMFRYNLVSLAGLGIQVGAFYVVGRALQNALHLEELG